MPVSPRVEDSYSGLFPVIHRSESESTSLIIPCFTQNGVKDDSFNHYSSRREESDGFDSFDHKMRKRLLAA